MYIGNKFNQEVIINTNLVSSITKETIKYNCDKRYIIKFCFSYTSEEFYSIWRFKREEDRDTAWACLKSRISVISVG